MSRPERRILVLGAYGLIGLPVTHRLLADNYAVTGLARSARRAAALIPDADFIEADLSDLTRAEDWKAHLQDIDVVVNASGVLQAGLGNDPEASQSRAIVALIRACEQSGITRFVQISAPGVSTQANTEFYRSKAHADQALTNSALNWTILRPGLVLSPQAYGGTALLRMLAAFPVVQPIFLPDALVQTVHIDDVVETVSDAVAGRLEAQDFDIVEAHPHRLVDIVLAVRRWLGVDPPKAVWNVPPVIGVLAAKTADALGWLGWNSALRSTSLAVLRNGVRGQPVESIAATPLDETLLRLPSTRQERLAARLSLVFPFLVFILSLFWIVSGVIGLIRMEAAMAILERALPQTLSQLFVVGGSVADIVVGALMAFRPTLRRGCLLGIGLAGGYLAASALLVPGLWLDPLGPMVKVFPAIALMILVYLIAEER